MTTDLSTFLVSWAIFIGLGAFATWGNPEGIENRWFKVIGITFVINCIITASRAIT